MADHRFDVFGTLVTVSASPHAWQAFYRGTDGTRRPADFIVPCGIEEHELAGYLADLFHESATPRHDGVKRLP
jgi:hypothetical protein